MRTKIIATIGPASATPERLLALRDAGMSVVRLNGSHATPDWHRTTIRMIRETLPEVPILLDIPGRKIRTMHLAHEPRFNAGDRIVLTTDMSHDGSAKVPVSHSSLHTMISPGDTIMADDGTLKFTVEAVEGRDIICIACSGGTLRSRKGINLPQVALEGPIVTEKDRELIAMAKESGVDYLGISFVESSDHIRQIREAIGAETPRIVAKVENAIGLRNTDQIAEAADAIMIDRGDLAVETSYENLAIAQKSIIRAARRHAKPVIVATEMLHSMISSLSPTKAEVSDVSNAVFDGAAALMLSGETAIGKYPIECITTMRRIAESTEEYLRVSSETLRNNESMSIPDAIGGAVRFICQTLPITKIVCVTRKGFAPRAISMQGLPQQVIAATPDASLALAANLLPGVVGVHVPVEFSESSLDHITATLAGLWERGAIDRDDMILVTAVGFPKQGSRMNLLQTHRVADLADLLGWKDPTPQRCAIA
jgi:pyruvate kinase